MTHREFLVAVLEKIEADGWRPTADACGFKSLASLSDLIHGRLKRPSRETLRAFGLRPVYRHGRELYDATELRAMLRDNIRQAGTLKAAAEELHLVPSAIHVFLNTRKREPAPRIVNALDLEPMYLPYEP